MPRYSRFTAFGHLRFTSAPTNAEQFYNSIDNALGGNWSLEDDTHQGATVFAKAMAYGRAVGAIERLLAEMRPETSDQLLNVLERDHGLAPRYSDTVEMRRAALAARMLLNRGSRRENVEDALRSVLGDDFLYYRVMRGSEAVSWPADPLTDPLSPGTFGRTDVPTKFFKTTTALSPGSFTFTYSTYDSTPTSNPLLVGDVAAVGLEYLGTAEKVTITATGTGTATATFVNAHSSGCSVVVGPTPVWTSSQRYVLIVVQPTTTITTEMKRLVNDVMNRVSRVVTTWFLIQPTSTSETGAFLVGDALGVRTLGTFAIP